MCIGFQRTVPLTDSPIMVFEYVGKVWRRQPGHGSFFFSFLSSENVKGYCSLLVVSEVADYTKVTVILNRFREA